MSKACTYCASTEHTSFYCYKKPRTPLARSTKVLKRTRVKQVGKYTKRWLDTRAEWISQNPGPWICHYGGCKLELGAMELDHKEPRSRRPDLRYVLDNLVPSCHFHNSEKRSLSHDEYRHICHI